MALLTKEDIEWSFPNTKGERSDITHNENGLYVASHYSKILRSQGSHIKVAYNADLKIIHLQPADKAGPGSYRCRYINTGEILKCRDQLAKEGMPYGNYTHIGDMVFQHVAEVSEAIKNPQ